MSENVLILKMLDSLFHIEIIKIMGLGSFAQFKFANTSSPNTSLLNQVRQPCMLGQ